MQLNNRGEMLCVWSGLVSVTIFFVAWVIFLGWLFPPPPSLDATQITQVYQQNIIGTRIAVALMANFAGPLSVVFATIITIYMLKMQGPSPALAWVNLATAAVQVVFFVIPAESFATAAYRLERAPEITQYANDFGWLIFDNAIGCTQVQWIAIGLAILWDRSPKPVLPRWFAFFCIWGAVIMLVNNMVIFFKSGPFAWNGLLGWWPGAVIFFLWYIVAFFVMHKAVRVNRAG